MCAADDEVDAINRQMYQQVKDGDPQESRSWIEPLIHMLSVSRHLERIADHATNIAEDVIYMVEGEIVRHRQERYSPRPDDDSPNPRPEGHSRVFGPCVLRPKN